jgi:hypothetical protein
MSSTSTSKKPSSKKRKRRVLSKEDQLKEEQLERYNSLVYMATKAIHKEAKVVKSFECQRIVRKLKQQQQQQQQSSCSSSDERVLAHVKGLSLERIERVFLQRLGIPNLNPHPPQEEEKVTVEETTTPIMTKEDEALVERILRHKRIVSAMETWNGRVTEYRRWFLRRQEQVSNLPDFAENCQTKKNKRSGAMFVCLGGATLEDEEGYEHYGPGGAGDEEDEYAAIVQKKNRAGQRARKAKAMAIQAKKEGRTWDNSVNWREKKNKDEKQQLKENTMKQPKQPAEIATMGKTWKEEGMEHPSWAARQSQKAGIVAFTGKKITFD